MKEKVVGPTWGQNNTKTTESERSGKKEKKNRRTKKGGKISSQNERGGKKKGPTRIRKPRGRGQKKRDAKLVILYEKRSWGRGLPRGNL